MNKAGIWAKQYVGTVETRTGLHCHQRITEQGNVPGTRLQNTKTTTHSSTLVLAQLAVHCCRLAAPRRATHVAERVLVATSNGVQGYKQPSPLQPARRHITFTRAHPDPWDVRDDCPAVIGHLLAHEVMHHCSAAQPATLCPKKINCASWLAGCETGSQGCMSADPLSWSEQPYVFSRMAG